MDDCIILDDDEDDFIPRPPPAPRRPPKKGPVTKLPVRKQEPGRSTAKDKPTATGSSRGSRSSPLPSIVTKSECVRTSIASTTAFITASSSKVEDVTSTSDLDNVCRMCYKDLSHLTETRKLLHMNQCLDNAESETNFEKDKEKYENTLDCPMCREPLAPGPFRTSHAKRCAEAHGISPQELLKLWNTQSTIAKKHIEQNKSHTKAVAPSKKEVKQPKLKNEPKTLCDEETQLAQAISASLSESFIDRAPSPTFTKVEMPNEARRKRPRSYAIVEFAPRTCRCDVSDSLRNRFVDVFRLRRRIPLASRTNVKHDEANDTQLKMMRKLARLESLSQMLLKAFNASLIADVEIKCNNGVVQANGFMMKCRTSLVIDSTSVEVKYSTEIVSHWLTYVYSAQCQWDECENNDIMELAAAFGPADLLSYCARLSGENENNIKECAKEDEVAVEDVEIDIEPIASGCNDSRAEDSVVESIKRLLDQTMESVDQLKEAEADAEENPLHGVEDCFPSFSEVFDVENNDPKPVDDISSFDVPIVSVEKENINAEAVQVADHRVCHLIAENSTEEQIDIAPSVNSITTQEVDAASNDASTNEAPEPIDSIKDMQDVDEPFDQWPDPIEADGSCFILEEDLGQSEKVAATRASTQTQSNDEGRQEYEMFDHWPEPLEPYYDNFVQPHCNTASADPKDDDNEKVVIFATPTAPNSRRRSRRMTLSSPLPCKSNDVVPCGESRRSSHRLPADVEEDDSFFAPVVFKTTRQSSEEMHDTFAAPSPACTPPRAQSTPNVPAKKARFGSNVKVLKTNDITPKPNYERFSDDVLKAHLAKNGLRPMVRKRAINTLNEIYEATHPLIDPSTPTVRPLIRKATSSSVGTAADCAPSTSKASEAKDYEDDEFDEEADKTLNESRDSDDVPAEETFVAVVPKDFEGKTRLFLSWLRNDNETLYDHVLSLQPVQLEELHVRMQRSDSPVACISRGCLATILNRLCVTYSLPNSFGSRRQKAARNKKK